MSARDHGVRELGNLKLRLREDLSFFHREFGDGPHWVVEDRTRSSFFRIGAAEYALISLFDGRTTVAEAIARTARSLGPDAFSENEAASVCRWLLDNDLAEPAEGGGAERVLRRAGGAWAGRLAKRLNLVIFRVPLFNPNRFLEAAMPWLGWLVGWPFFALWVAVVASGFVQILVQADRFAASAAGILAVGNGFWLIVAYVLLKVFHELFHGLACKRHGGDLFEAGAIFILFVPLGYVDATSSWRFPSRWQRIHVAVAGMYIEFFLAGVAAWVWATATPGVASHLAYNVVIVASVSTLLFNANPLMRFDGYYVLSDLLGIPNLYPLGQVYVRWLGRRFLVGADVSLPDWDPHKRRVVAIYGLAAFAWRILAMTTLVLLSASLFRGAGIFIALIAAILWVGLPAYRFLRYLRDGDGGEAPDLRRFALRAASASIVSLLVLTQVTCSPVVRAPAVVAYAGPATLRVESPGFVEEVSVADGEEVAEGQLLLRLRNDDLRADLRSLELQVEQLEIRARIRRGRGDITAEQVLRREIAVVQENAREKRRLVEDLEVRAPRAGRVIAAIDLQVLEGRYLGLGRELFDVASESEKELRVAIAEDAVEDFRGAVGESVRAALPGRLWGRVDCRLDRVDPRASNEIVHPELTALWGGEIAVRARGGGRAGFELLEPRFDAVASLDAAQGGDLRSGQRVTLEVRALRRSLGAMLYRAVDRWVRRLTATS